jgi:hypothetical protein
MRRAPATAIVLVAAVLAATATGQVSGDGSATIPPQVAAERNLIRVTAPAFPLPDCDDRGWTLESFEIQDGTLFVLGSVWRSGRCEAQREGFLRMEVTGVPAGEYAVTVRLRSRSNREETLVDIEALAIVVPGDPDPATSPSLTLADDRGDGDWQKLVDDAGPPGAITDLRLVPDLED